MQKATAHIVVLTAVSTLIPIFDIKQTLLQWLA
ncbi:hypothetical protein SAMN05428975_0768 [Mucilaginibacter sp. OK268]|nr:hypothetical protein SAMN05428975_0768 [Mucilaginibacter sp. OK268]